MIKFNSINLDITNKCSNQCPACYRQRGVPYGGSDISLSDIEKIATYFDTIRFCGQISDPVMHPQFHDIMKVCVKYKRKMQIHTAVSSRSHSWWKTAFDLSVGNDVEWIFGIDGLPKDSSKYRINQDGEKLFEIMKMCASMGIKTIWQFIIFNYNQNYLSTCKQIADEYGIIFRVGKSARFKSKYKIEKLRPSIKWRSDPCDLWIDIDGNEKPSNFLHL